MESSISEKSRFWYIRNSNKIKGFYKKKQANKYLFILSPPYSGSTLLQQIISTSKNVSSNNPIGKHKEGQKIPELKNIMFKSIDSRWSEDFEIPWEYVKSIWNQYWDLSRIILLEKSPPNLVRAKKIQEVFNPCFFIVLMRNPYVICESWIRRLNSNITEPAKIIAKCIRLQKENLDSLENTIYFKYEDIVSDKMYFKEKLLGFLPEVSDINLETSYNAHNFLNKNLPITNLNIGKIERLSFEEIELANNYFKSVEDAMSELGYEIIQPD